MEETKNRSDSSSSAESGSSSESKTTSEESSSNVNTTAPPEEHLEKPKSAPEFLSPVIYEGPKLQLDARGGLVVIHNCLRRLLSSLLGHLKSLFSTSIK
jgi:hypothetical protein